MSHTEQYLETAGLAAMRQELHEIEWEEAEVFTQHLHADAQQRHDLQAWGGEQ